MTAVIRLLIADDQALVREGVQALMATEPDIQVVGTAADGLEAVAQTLALRPDVVLMDLMMPRQDGIESILQIRRQAPETRILVVTSFSQDDKVFPAIKAGALGYLLKDASPQELVQAIRTVNRGESFLHPTIAGRLIRELNQPAAPAPAADPLTERERQVLVLLAHGLSNQEIADRLVLGESTVRSHVSNILSKLHLPSRMQAALYALREGLADLDS
jgi:NarL family two-component system response regulator LiaR